MQWRHVYAAIGGGNKSLPITFDILKILKGKYRYVLQVYCINSYLQ